MAPQASATAGSAASNVNRTRSVRNGAPVSARAAARKPAQDNDTAAEDVRAEMQAKLDELNERLHQAETSYDSSQKLAAVLQVKLDEALKDQGTLEEQFHEHTERIEELENEKKESLRARRELEQIYEAERVASMKEKEVVQTREDEMQSSLQRMKEALAQREMRAGLDDERRPSVSRTSSFRSNAASPNPDGTAGQFAPPSSLQRSDSRSSSKLVMQKDKIIEGLRLELAEAQIKLVEVDNMGGSRLQALQKQMMEIKIQNARLMEENESFQLLLSEKTLNGDLFTAGQTGDLLRMPSNAGSRPPSRQPNAVGASLADELDNESQADESFLEGSITGGPSDELSKRLQSEVNSLKDQNKALTLYINNIISRLLQHEQFEQILDKTPDIIAGPNAASRKHKPPTDTEKELPPPPPEKDDIPALPVKKEAEEEEEQPLQPTGFLQRAKSVMGGNRPKRPMSMAVPQADQQALQSQLKAGPEEPRVTENPQTAPAIPLARSKSSRTSSGHRRANSEWPAASFVTNMYRGPSPGLQGPTSPGLASPVSNRSSFFGPPIGLGTRVPSGSTVPTISEAETNKENLQQRDSKMAAHPGSHRSSVISNTGGNSTLDVAAGDLGETALSDLSNPSSPPRSTASSGDRDSKQGGAIMMGSRMRPLRLVQDAAAQEDAVKKAGNRGSWFGWMNKGGAAPPGVGRSLSGGESAS